jgi:hypothetical protein
VQCAGDAWAPSTIAAAVWAGRRYAEDLDTSGPAPRDRGYLREYTGLAASPGYRTELPAASPGYRTELRAVSGRCSAYSPGTSAGGAEAGPAAVWAAASRAACRRVGVPAA